MAMGRDVATSTTSPGTRTSGLDLGVEPEIAPKTAVRTAGLKSIRYREQSNQHEKATNDPLRWAGTARCCDGNSCR